MTLLIADTDLEQQLREQRRAWGADHHDEVWEGVYFVAPIADDDHQDLVALLTASVCQAIMSPGLGKVRPGVEV